MLTFPSNGRFQIHTQIISSLIALPNWVWVSWQIKKTLEWTDIWFELRSCLEIKGFKLLKSLFVDDGRTSLHFVRSSGEWEWVWEREKRDSVSETETSWSIFSLSLLKNPYVHKRRPKQNWGQSLLCDTIEVIAAVVPNAAKSKPGS